MNQRNRANPKFQDLMDELAEAVKLLPESSPLLRRLQDIHKSAALEHNDNWLRLQNLVGDANRVAWADGVGISVALLFAREADVVRDFRKSRWVAAIAVRQLLGQAVATYKRGSVLASFVLLRAALERIADFCVSLQAIETALEELQASIEKSELDHFLTELRRLVLKKGGAKTRFDFREAHQITSSSWRSDFAYKQLKKVPMEDASRIDEYFQPPDKYDQKASNALSAIQKLDRDIDGLWVSYSFLSEFAHPNVGGNWALSQVRRLSLPDDADTPSDQIPWVEERLGLDPKEFVSNSELSGPRDGTLETVVESTRHFHERLKSAERLEKQIVEAIQYRLWGMRKNLMAVWGSTARCACGSGQQSKECCLRTPGRNDQCGCGSQKKFKNCCGASLKSH